MGIVYIIFLYYLCIVKKQTTSLIYQTPTTMNDKVLKQIRRGNLSVKVMHDNCPLNPRQTSEYLGKLHLYASGYIEYSEITFDMDPHDYIVLPIYGYIHSGITISLTPFSCAWDSGTIGFIAYNKAEISKIINSNEIETMTAYCKELATAEIREYDAYIQGACYFLVLKNTTTKEKQSCGCFYGQVTRDDIEMLAGLVGIEDNSIFNRFPNVIYN